LAEIARLAVGLVVGLLDDAADPSGPQALRGALIAGRTATARP
jgi:hypothetical protein